MKEDNLERLFKNLENDFDIEMPETGHEQRFLNRLKSDNHIVSKKPKHTFYRPFIAIAASLILFFGVIILLQKAGPQFTGKINVIIISGKRRTRITRIGTNLIPIFIHATLCWKHFQQSPIHRQNKCYLKI